MSINRSVSSKNIISSGKIIEIRSDFAKNTAAGTEQAKVRIPRPAAPYLLNKVSVFNPSIDTALTVKLFNRRTMAFTGTARAAANGTAQAVTGTAQAGDATHITLAAGSSASDDAYNGKIIEITAGTGAGQSKTIADYAGSTKIATVTAWETNPDATSVYLITEDTTHIMLAADSSASNDTYNALVIRITAGTGEGQMRTISDYVGTTKVATISVAWETLPDATSVYVITQNATHIDLGALANPTNDHYNTFALTITSGTGIGQSKVIADYVGATSVAEVTAWTTLPDDTSTYSIAMILDSLIYEGVFAKASLTAPTVLANDSDVIQGLFSGGCDVYYQVSNDDLIANADASRFASIFVLEPVC